jgi:hypothetical protein
LIEIGLLVLWRMVFLNINTCKYAFPYCGPSRPPGTMIWTNLNLHYIRKLSCKYELFWLCGFLNDPAPFLHFCNYLRFKEDLAHKVAHNIKFLFNGSIKLLLLAMILQSKHWKKAPNYFIWIFWGFSRKDKKCVLFVNKTFLSPFFVVIWCTTWISNKTCLNDFDRHSNFLQKKKNIYENWKRHLLIFFMSIHRIFEEYVIWKKNTQKKYIL